MNFTDENVFKIISKKHDNSLHRSWEENIILFNDHNILVGGNDRTIVLENDGKKWRTKEPALFYFSKIHWFNIILLFQENTYFYYCNLSSPFEWHNNELHYIDYDIDVIVQADYSFEVKDEMEYEENCLKYHYPESIQKQIMNGKNELITMIENRITPFNEQFIDKWKSLFLTRMKKT